MRDIHMNRARKRTALAPMRRHDRTAWRHAGLEIACVAGEETLRIRKSKTENVSAVEDLPTDAVPAAERGISSADAEAGEETVDEGEATDAEGLADLEAGDEVRH